MFEHTLLIRVYYADTDSFGIVYHANYLRFCEMARTESLRERGIGLPYLMTQYGIQFAVVNANLTYHKPAQLDDQLLIVSTISNVGRASVTYQQDIYLDDKQGPLICSVSIKLVSVDQNMRPQALPDALKMEIV